MGVKKFIKKSVAFVAAAAMALTMVVAPVGAGADDSYAEGTGSNDGLHLNKTIKLQEDGTYKIRLEAYATGTVTKTDPTVRPCDIVLVLDQSGSMAYGLGDAIKCSDTTSEQEALGATEGYYCYMKEEESIFATEYYYKVRYKNNRWQYFTNNSNWNGNGSWKDLDDNSSIYVSRIGSLKQSVTNFVNSIKDNSKDVNHKIAIVGYANDSRTGTSYSGFISPGSNSSEDSYMNTGVFKNGTLNNYSENLNYTNALVNVKDGDAVTSSITTAIGNIACNGATYTEYGLLMANKILEANKYDGNDKVVVVFTDGETDSNISSVMTQSNTLKDTNKARVYTVGMFENTTDSIKNFLSYMSSNYGSDVSYNWGRYRGTYNNTNKYSMTASNKNELNNIFTTIAGDIQGNADVELDASAVTRDIITDNLDIPENLSSNVNAYTESYLGNNDWQKDTEEDANKPQVSTSGRTVDVTNFDFAENFVSEANPSKDIPVRGKRLVIEISNLTAVKSGENMITNVTEQSGVYENNQSTTPLKTFNECSITIPDKSYVLDYGKTVVSNEVKNDCGISNVKLYSTAKPSPRGISTTGRYGTFDLTNVANGGTITYTPDKINWDGFDSVYVFGEKSANSTTDKYLWSAVNFIPASSVYYEDDFGKTDNKDSEIAIVWSGKDWSKAPDSTSTSTTDKNQSSKNEVYGWDDSYKENLGYSDGSATMTNTKGATATFTFTGTGVDVYSRTNGAVGLIRGAVYSGVGATNKDGSKKETVQSKYIDNVSTSGDYYQIPTLSFENLDYGTYTVVITAGAKGKGTSGTYYLDGIRVYNPLKGNDTAEKAYDQAGDGESKAEYIKLRDTLIAKGFGTTDESKPGSVFIDSMNGEDSVIVGKEEDYTKYGPKNEVYLAKDQAVAFEIEGYANASIKPNVFIGLKALNEATSATITNGEGKLTKEIKSSSDLYYQVKPTSSGRIVIKNNTDKILSITKVRITKANNKPKLMATPELLSYVAGFDSLSETESSGINEDNKGDKESNLDKDDVEIDNPSDSTDNDKQESNNSVWNRILNSLKNWFKK